MEIEKQEYTCPKCGTVTDYMEVHGVPEYEGKYCMICYARWVNKTIPKLKQYTDKNEDK